VGNEDIFFSVSESPRICCTEIRIDRGKTTEYSVEKAKIRPYDPNCVRWADDPSVHGVQVHEFACKVQPVERHHPNVSRCR
jgi:hypothetical protein